MKNPLFSIIIPTYNRAKFLEGTLASVLEQSLGDFEIIVVDDGSQDETTEIMNRLKNQDPRIHFYSKENGERGAARNFGAQKARGKYLSFLDSDDRYYPHYLENAQENLKAKDWPVFFHQAYEIINAQGQSSGRVDRIHEDETFTFVRGNPLSCLGVFVEREAFLAHQFQEDRALAGSEDWELWTRLFAHYGLKTDDRVCAALVQHDSRSVLHFSEAQLAQRRDLALKYAFQDEAVQKVFAQERKKMEAYWDTYLALHLALSGENKSAGRYLWRGLKAYPALVFGRRFFAIIKRSLLNFFAKRNASLLILP